MRQAGLTSAWVLIVLLCGCQRPPEPAPKPDLSAPPAVPGVPPAADPAAPSAGRPNYDHLKPVFFLRSVEPSDDSTTAAKAFVKTYGLTTRDLERIRALPSVADVIPVRFIPSEVKYLDRTATVRIAATDSGYADVYSFKPSAGRFLTAADNNDATDVCVLKPRVAAALFLSENPLGKSVTARGHAFRVVGVLSEDRGEADPSVYIPFRTARARFGEITLVKGKATEKVDLHEIIVRVREPDQRDKVATAVGELLEARHPKKDWETTFPPPPLP